MKKKWFILGSLAIIAGLLFCGCGKKNAVQEKQTGKQDAVYHPCGGSVTVGDYKSLSYSLPEITVSDEMVNRQVQVLLKSIPNFVPDDSNPERSIAEGDLVSIDFTGTVGGVPFEGGSAEDLVINIGSETLIDGFESGLIGAKAGERRTLPITFPNPYPNNPELSGAQAEFAVTVNYFARQIDEITDEYVRKNSESYQTAEEFLEFIRKQILDLQLGKAEEAAENGLLNKVVQSSEFHSIDEADVDFYYRKLMDNYVSLADRQEMDMDSFAKQFTDYGDYAGLQEACRAQALNSVKQFMVLQVIAENEKITVSEEEYDAYLLEIMQEGNYSDAATVEHMFGHSYIEYSKKMEKTAEYIRSISRRVETKQE